MRLMVGILALLAGSILVGQSRPVYPQSEGVRPRAQASEYAAQARNERAILAASVVAPEQVKQRFASDISKTYIVVEIACYPAVPGPVAIHYGDFSVRLSSTADSIYPVEAATVAANIDRKNHPNAAGQTVPVYGGVNVGYETGDDPYSGRRGHTVYVGAGVGVGSSPVGSYPGSSGYPVDRGLLEEQLWHRSLPEGDFTRPVAGYLYFPVSLLKKEKGFYLLQVLGEANARWELRVPLARK